MRAKEMTLRARQLLAGGLAALLINVAGSAQEIGPADDEPEAEVEEIRRYTVELIIFEYPHAAGAGELFLPDEPPPAEVTGEIPQFGDPTTTLPGAVPATAPQPDMPLPTSADAEDVPLAEIVLPPQVEMVLMGPGDYTMNEIYDKLVTLDAYRPLMRTGWTQIAIGKEEAPPLRLRMLGTPPLRLDGSLTLYLGRFLHLVVDLTMDADLPEPEPAWEQRPDPAWQRYPDPATDYATAYPAVRAEAPAPVRYRILEDRIVRNGELRYFDHPRFGVLARTTRFEVPEEEQPVEDPQTLLSAGE